MAFGDVKAGTLTVNAASVTNPFNLTGATIAVVAGDLIVGAVFEQGSTASAMTATDNLTNTYAYPTAKSTSTNGGRAFYSIVTQAGNLTQISLAMVASSANAVAVARVITGPFLSVDAVPANSLSTDLSSPFTCPTTGTLAQASEVVIGWAVSNGSATWTATSPNILIGQAATAAIGSVRLGAQTVAATTAVAPVFAGTNPTSNVLGTFSVREAPAAQGLTPTAYTDDDTFFTQVVGVGAVNLSPTLFEASQTYYTQVVDQPIATQDLTPSLFADGETFYTQTIGVGAVNLSPTLYADDDTFYTQTVAAGAVDLAPSLFTNSNTFFTQVVEQGAQDLAPDLFADDDTFYTQTVSVGAVNLAPSLFGDGETFYTQAVGVGAVDLSPTLFEDADTFYSQTVTVVEPQALEPDLFANDNTFHSSTLSVGSAPALGAVRGPGRKRKSSRRTEEHTPRITEEFIAELRQAREAREAAERAKEAAEKREPKQVRTEANKTAALARKQAPDPTWKELQEAATALSRANKQSAQTVQRLADAVIQKAKAVERKIEHERKIQEDEDDLIAVLLLAA
jgi:hypothetical protein